MVGIIKQSGAMVRQPVGPAMVNDGNPISLRLSSLPNYALYNAMRSFPKANISALPKIKCRERYSTPFPATVKGELFFAPQELIAREDSGFYNSDLLDLYTMPSVAQGGVTAFARVYSESFTPGVTKILLIFTDYNFYSTISIRKNTSDFLVAIINIDASPSIGSITLTSNVTPIADTIYNVTVICDSGRQEFWIDGILVASANVVTSGSTGASNPWDTLAITNTNARVSFSAMWTRALPSSEISGLSQNPWQLFKPIRPKMYAFPPTVKNDAIAIRTSKTKAKWQPQTPVDINWNNPITKDLIAGLYCLNDKVIDSVNRKILVANEASTRAIKNDINGLNKSPTLGTNAYEANIPAISNKYSCTVFFQYYFHPAEIVNLSRGFFNMSLGLGVEQPAAIKAFYYNPSFLVESVSATTDEGVIGNAAATYEFEVGLKLYINGKYGNGVATTTTFGQIPSVRGIYVQDYIKSFCAGTFEWKRILSTQEIQSISENPWQIFKSNKPTFYSLPSRIIHGQSVARIK